MATKTEHDMNCICDSQLYGKNKVEQSTFIEIPEVGISGKLLIFIICKHLSTK